LNKVIKELQALVRDINLVARNTGFVWKVFDESVKKAQKAFWSKRPAMHGTP